MRGHARGTPCMHRTVVRGGAGSAADEGESSSSTDDALQDLARNRDDVIVHGVRDAFGVYPRGVADIMLARTFPFCATTSKRVSCRISAPILRPTKTVK